MVGRELLRNNRRPLTRDLQCLWLFEEFGQKSPPVELAFQRKYGNIVSYKWFETGNLLVGFSSGHVIVVSTTKEALGDELFSVRLHREGSQCLPNMKPMI